MAVDLVKGLTGDIAGVTTLSQRSQQLLPELLKLISDSDSIQRSAITSLVNLCQVSCKGVTTSEDGPEGKECPLNCLAVAGCRSHEPAAWVERSSTSTGLCD